MLIFYISGPCLICDGISEILMLDECVCSFLLVIFHKILLCFVTIVNALWVPYRGFEKGMRMSALADSRNLLLFTADCHIFRTCCLLVCTHMTCSCRVGRSFCKKKR